MISVLEKAHDSFHTQVKNFVWQYIFICDFVNLKQSEASQEKSKLKKMLRNETLASLFMLD